MVTATNEILEPTAIHQASNDSDTSTAHQESCTEDLPLVLLTVGSCVGESEVLYEHLEAINDESIPEYQTLIVTRPGVSDVVFSALAARIRSLPHVHLRRLGEKVDGCSELQHKTGTFFASRKGLQRRV